MSDVNIDLPCFYCQREGYDLTARVTLHDESGCRHACIRHAKQQMSIGLMSGHSADCAAAKHDAGSLNSAQLVQACQNIGFDLTCGACAALFYTGANLYEHAASCKTESGR